MKLLRRALLTLLPAAMGLWLVGMAGITPAGAALPSAANCSTGVLSSGTYISLSLAPDSQCFIEPGATVTIAHPVTLPSGSFLVVGVTPDLTAVGPASLTIMGSVSLSDSSGLLVVAGAVKIGGPLRVGPNALFSDPGSNPLPVTLGGGVTVQSHGAFIFGSFGSPSAAESAIHGPVVGIDPSTIQISTSDVSGPVTVLGGGGTNAVIPELPGSASGYNTIWLAADTISGPVTVLGFGGNFVMIGSPQSDLGLGTGPADTIAGPLVVIGNSLTGFPPSFPGFWDVNANTVNGSALCFGNSPGANIGGSNVVSGHVNTCG
jgi:hypothetical protein